MIVDQLKKNIVFYVLDYLTFVISMYVNYYLFLFVFDWWRLKIETFILYYISVL